MDKEQNLKKINSNLEKLSQRIDKANSFKQNFIRGIYRGIGSAIGATVIFALLIGILSQTIKSAEDIPILNKIIQSTHIENVINTTQNNN